MRRLSSLSNEENSHSFQLRDAEKVTSSSDRFVHPAGLRLGGKRPKAVVNLFASRQNYPALGQLMVVILEYFALFARVLQKKDVDASGACGSHDAVSVVFCP